MGGQPRATLFSKLFRHVFDVPSSSFQPCGWLRLGRKFLESAILSLHWIVGLSCSPLLHKGLCFGRGYGTRRCYSLVIDDMPRLWMSWCMAYCLISWQLLLQRAVVASMVNGQITAGSCRHEGISARLEAQDMQRDNTHIITLQIKPVSIVDCAQGNCGIQPWRGGSGGLRSTVGPSCVEAISCCALHL